MEAIIADNWSGAGGTAFAGEAALYFSTTLRQQKTEGLRRHSCVVHREIIQWNGTRSRAEVERTGGVGGRRSCPCSTVAARFAMLGHRICATKAENTLA